MTDDAIKRIVGPTIILASGGYFDFEAPQRSPIEVGDIAAALSKLCRFTGQCDRFYSVAEHSVHASRLVPEADKFAALMHDAVEAYVGDVSRPLKSLLPVYKEIETRVEREIFKVFRLPDSLPESVHVADRRMLRLEQRELFDNRDRCDFADGVEIPDLALECWPPEIARERFLARFRRLYPAHLDRLPSQRGAL